MTEGEKSEKQVEIANAKEEVKEIVEQCNYCGLCKELDPVFKILREEAISARGKCILFSKETFDSNVFDAVLDGSCRVTCPFGIDIDTAIRKARKILNLKGQENPINQEILKKINNKQNPFSSEISED